MAYLSPEKMRTQTGSGKGSNAHDSTLDTSLYPETAHKKTWGTSVGAHKPKDGIASNNSFIVCALHPAGKAGNATLHAWALALDVVEKGAELWVGQHSDQAKERLGSLIRGPAAVDVRVMGRVGREEHVYRMR